jgi:hypothetical protein
MSQVTAWIIATTFALVASFASLYFHFLHVTGPKIRLINENDEQRSVLRHYAGLPSALQQHFPPYRDHFLGHAIVRLVLANSGDRSGYARISDVEVDVTAHGGWSSQEEVITSYYDYGLVPARSVADHVILLRNIRPIDGDKKITVTFKLTSGGTGRFGRLKKFPVVSKSVRVVLKPGDLHRLVELQQGGESTA